MEGTEAVYWSMTLMSNIVGIISSQGELWREQRRFTHTVLKDLGIGRVKLEPNIQEEIEVTS